MPTPLANITKEAFVNNADLPSKQPSNLDQTLFDIDAIPVAAVAVVQPVGQNNDDDDDNDVVVEPLDSGVED